MKVILEFEIDDTQDASLLTGIALTQLDVVLGFLKSIKHVCQCGQSIETIMQPELSPEAEADKDDAFVQLHRKCSNATAN